MTSFSTPTGPQSAPAVRRATFSPKEVRSLMRQQVRLALYRDRVALARKAAETGLGFEDLVVFFNLAERDAKHIVFGRT